MKYFTFFEFEYSATAVEKKIKNYPTVEYEENIRALVENLLDPIRERYGKPIIIGSGFRNPAVNSLVGGVANSQHMTGCAADLQTHYTDKNERKEGNKRLFKLIQEMGGFDQLINEHDYSWVHVSYNPKGPQRGQVLNI